MWGCPRRSAWESRSILRLRHHDSSSHMNAVLDARFELGDTWRLLIESLGFKAWVVSVAYEWDDLATYFAAGIVAMRAFATKIVRRRYAAVSGGTIK